jgi:hypothetical protein
MVRINWVIIHCYILLVLIMQDIMLNLQGY